MQIQFNEIKFKTVSVITFLFTLSKYWIQRTSVLIVMNDAGQYKQKIFAPYLRRENLNNNFVLSPTPQMDGNIQAALRPFCPFFDQNIVTGLFL